MSNDPFARDADATSRPLDNGRRKRPREITGRIVLVWMLAFFGVVVGVNAFMAHEALSTFGGVETESSYRAGQNFTRDLAMAKAQDDQHWQIEAKVTPAPGGQAVLDITARDAAGMPLTGLAAVALFARPTDRRLDRTMAVSENAPGQFHGSAEIPPGQWDLVIELSRHGERLFRSKNRIALH
jgi:nitrogen fixation protein FixH